MEGRRISSAKQDLTARSADTFKALRDDLTAEVEALNLLHRISSHYVLHRSMQEIYQAILDAAITITRADKGNMKLAEGTNLRIIAQRGFGKEFLRFFDTVVPGQGACGLAYKKRKRIITYNILQDNVFNEMEKQILRNESLVCVQSTPMVSSSGAFIGVMSTHYTAPHVFPERELRMLDLLARQAADVIERKQVDEELEKERRRTLALVEELKIADRKKDEFLCMLSHELRNPLAVISAGLQLIEAAEEKAQAMSAIEVIQRQTKQLYSLLDDLLDYTRIVHNKIELKKKKVDLNELVVLTAEEQRPLFAEKGITLETVTEGNKVIIDADPVRLKQIIGNLLHNSLKFTESGGQTRLSAHKEDGEAVIRVADDGMGINPEILPKIFEPFSQADAKLDRRNGGLGLGLSIVKGIAELHGGKVSAYSEGQGKGSVFAIMLPLVSDADCGYYDNKPQCKCDRKLKILLIDDNKDFSAMMATMLTLMGHNVQTAYNGPEGISRAKELIPDVIFCDIGLPGMDGFSVAKIIRAEPALDGVHLVALTGYTSKKDVENAFASGFNVHLAKPVDMATIQGVLRGAQGLRAEV